MRELVRYLHDSLQTENVYVYLSKAFVLAGSTRQLDPMPKGRQTALRVMLERPLRVEAVWKRLRAAAIHDLSIRPGFVSRFRSISSHLRGLARL